LRDLQEQGEPDLVHELIALFLDGTPPRLHAIRAAADRREGPTLAQQAHLLKGSCAGLGARPMAEICEELEALGRREDLGQVGSAVDRLSAEYEHVREVLCSDYAGTPA
jgi:HPt (histidine-containing phosphotransfer) domain-containing protein